MAKSNARTVEDYLNELPAERRAVIEQARQVILDNLPPGYQEAMNWGMISYEVPLARYPKTYNQQPLSYAGLAAQKNGYSLYLMCAYNGALQEGWLAERFAAAGKKLDMGKSCPALSPAGRPAAGGDRRGHRPGRRRRVHRAV
jgi:hypothetical protein